MKKLNSFGGFSKQETNENNAMIMKTLDGFKTGNSINEGFGSFLNDIYQKLKIKLGLSDWRDYVEFLNKENRLPGGISVYLNSRDLSFSSYTEEGEFTDYEKKGLRDLNLAFESVKIDENLDFAEDMNVANVDMNEMLEQISDSYNFRIETGQLASVYIWGAPGIGKTKIIEQYAKKMGIDMIVFHLSQIEPADLKGFPEIINIDGKSRSTTALPTVFPWFKDAKEEADKDRGGILFLDEINRAPKDVLAGALPLAQDGKFEGYTLPKKWIIVSAGNRPDDIGGQDIGIEPALANRFAHLNFIPTVEDWSKWAKNVVNEGDGKMAIDPKLIAFLNFKENTEWFHSLDDDNPSNAWPSPRSWAIASSFIYSKGRRDFDKVSIQKQIKIYSYFVGIKAATAYKIYLDLTSIISKQQIAGIYSKGIIPKIKLTKANQYAVLSAIAYFKAGTKLTIPELRNIIKFSSEFGVLDNNTELQTMFMSALKGAHMKTKNSYYISDEEPWASVYDEWLEAWHGDMEDIQDKMDGSTKG